MMWILPVLFLGWINCQYIPTRCFTSYAADVKTYKKYGCSVSFTEEPSKTTTVKMEYEHCKSPPYARIHKKTVSMYDRKPKEFHHSFTESENVYRHQVGNDPVAMILNFTKSKNMETVSVALIFEDQSRTYDYLTGVFSASKRDCMWYDTLSEGEKVGFISGAVAGTVIILTVLFVLVGLRLRRRYGGRHELKNEERSLVPVEDRRAVAGVLA